MAVLGRRRGTSGTMGTRMRDFSRSVMRHYGHFTEDAQPDAAVPAPRWSAGLQIRRPVRHPRLFSVSLLTLRRTRPDTANRRCSRLIPSRRTHPRQRPFPNTYRVKCSSLNRVPKPRFSGPRPMIRLTKLRRHTPFRPNIKGGRFRSTLGRSIQRSSATCSLPGSVKPRSCRIESSGSTDSSQRCRSHPRLTRPLPIPDGASVRAAISAWSTCKPRHSRISANPPIMRHPSRLSRHRVSRSQSRSPRSAAYRPMTTRCPPQRQTPPAGT